MNERFPLDLITQDISKPGDEKPTYRLNNPFVYISSDKEEIVIPAGFIFDGASVPQLLWSVVSPSGEVMRAALVHDWFYLVQTTGRRKADDMMKEAMRAYGVKKSKILLWWFILRTFGGFAWKNNKKKLEPQFRNYLLRRQEEDEVWWMSVRKNYIKEDA